MDFEVNVHFTHRTAVELIFNHDKVNLVFQSMTPLKKDTRGLSFSVWSSGKIVIFKSWLQLVTHEIILFFTHDLHPEMVVQDFILNLTYSGQNSPKCYFFQLILDFSQNVTRYDQSSGFFETLAKKFLNTALLNNRKHQRK